MSFLILVVSSALFFFYVQAFCERAIRHEFSQPYFQDVIATLQLEYPRLGNMMAPNGSLDYSAARLALQCDFLTLGYLMKNSDPTQRRLSRIDKVLSLYFRFLLICLPIRHAFKFKEKEAVVNLASILQYFANVLGEKLSASSFDYAQANLES